jgi:hypothetical protein
MGDPEQQSFGRVDRAIIRKAVQADIGFLDQILDILGPVREFSQIAV